MWPRKIPEPEFVAINGENEIVVTLQENNHMVVLSADGTVLSPFFRRRGHA